eukprot:gnl/TRDRNA2_/TRDRNA2_199805_c0_seq1.p1 gnl/TRDRNA2_/TRDRNA2_199805_c0~~gnl/TRDRNA2_/TRDRNA2_199805_c0_seq1.p1  ORF type:complete len:353 (+),score=28.58 gnl/TRDRNA2_/TRDRNA2_199805_c0_seq1:62-1060(+)
MSKSGRCFLLLISLCALGYFLFFGALDVVTDECEGSWVANLERREKKTYSQNGEDGVILSILEHVAVASKYYVEFGVQDGRERNTRALEVHSNWTGLLLDGDPWRWGRTFAVPNLHKEFITPASVCDLFEKYAVPSRFGLLSVDIDSYDFWVLRAILDRNYTPDVIVVEVNSQVSEGLFTVPPPEVTGQARIAPGTLGFGASPEAFDALGAFYGYKMVYCEQRGVNCFLVRKSLLASEALTCISTSLRKPPCYGGYVRGTCQRYSCDPKGISFCEVHEGNLSVKSCDINGNYASACLSSARKPPVKRDKVEKFAFARGTSPGLPILRGMTWR